MNITPSTQAPTGFTGTLGVEVFDVTTLDVLIAHTVIGVAEVSPETYVFNGDIPDNSNWVAVFDHLGTYTFDSGGAYPVVQADSGLVGTIGIQFLDPATDTVAIAHSVAGIAEIVPTGIYVYSGTLPVLPRYVAVWDTGGGSPQRSEEEFGEPATPGHISPLVQAPTGLVGTMGVTVIDVLTGATLIAHTTAGITEVSTETYVFNGTIPTTSPNWVAVFDNGSGGYSFDSDGNYPVTEAPSGLTGTIGLRFIDPLLNLVVVDRTTSDISEVGSSGVYYYHGPLPGLERWVVAWDTGGPDPSYSEEEFFGSLPASLKRPLITYRSVGDRRTPQEIKRLRRENMDFCRRLGQPVMLKHQYNTDDLDAGTAFLNDGGIVTTITDSSLAKRCPACFNTTYKQSRHDCPVCFGVTIVSLVIDDITNMWIEDGQLVSSDGGSHVRAPKYGGYGIGSITWMIEPDVSIDVFRINEQGVLIQTENGQGVAPWFPLLGDNDLCVNLVLDSSLSQILDKKERFQLKLTNPVTMRGFGVRAQEQDYKIAQTFGMAHAPKGNILYGVPVDR